MPHARAKPCRLQATWMLTTFTHVRQGKKGMQMEAQMRRYHGTSTFQQQKGMTLRRAHLKT